MPSPDGWRGTVPTIPAGAGRLAVGLLSAAILAAAIASVLGWAAVVLAAAAVVAGVWLATSGWLDRLEPEGDARPRADRPAPPAHAGATRSSGAADRRGAASSAPVGRHEGVPVGQEVGRAAGAGPVSGVAIGGGRDVAAALGSLAEQLGAVRLVVWRRAPEDGSLEPVRTSERLPPRLPPAGQPLAWALDQDQPMHVEEPPRWAYGPLLAVPFPLGGGRALLTVETDGTASGREPGDGAEAASLTRAGQAAAVLRIVLELAEREEVARTAHARFESILDFLRAVPKNPDEGGTFPDGLAEAARTVAGGIGAAVASWEGESGQVLSSRGVGGGPVVGTWFGVMEGDLAITARAGTTLVRDRREGKLLPLAEPGERWTARPRFTGITPLRDATGSTGGLVAVWGDEPLARDGLELLEALGPLLALQLRHSTHLARFRQQATEDALTGLANRGALEERLELERKRFHRYRNPTALLVLDLDHFKRINDTHGHPAGDAVLARVADVLREETRETDLVARYGGEEMVVLMEQTMRHAAAEVAERIRSAIAATRFEWNEVVIPVTASIGVSACPECVDDPEELMRSADEALYASKKGGRNRVTTAAMRSGG